MFSKVYITEIDSELSHKKNHDYLFIFFLLTTLGLAGASKLRSIKLKSFLFCVIHRNSSKFCQIQRTKYDCISNLLHLKLYREIFLPYVRFF